MDAIEGFNRGCSGDYFLLFLLEIIILYQPQTPLLCLKVKYKTNLFCNACALGIHSLRTSNALVTD